MEDAAINITNTTNIEMRDIFGITQPLKWLKPANDSLDCPNDLQKRMMMGGLHQNT